MEALHITDKLRMIPDAQILMLAPMDKEARDEVLRRRLGELCWIRVQQRKAYKEAVRKRNEIDAMATAHRIDGKPLPDRILQIRAQAALRITTLEKELSR